MNYYEVITKARFSATTDSLTYASSEPIDVGSVVQVPFGTRTTSGVVVSETTKPSFDTKEISSVVYESALTSPQLSLLKWIAQYYASPEAEVMNLFLPQKLEANPRQTYSHDVNTEVDAKSIELNAHQEKALKRISSISPKTALLHGITGSGKTRIYMKRARTELESGKSAIILVPEINLTPQLVAEFKSYFGNVYFTHSKLTAAERRNIWLSIRRDDQPKIIVGPRSALFLPVQKLGLIVIDEFHESSYKQDKTPKYDTVRVAAQYAHLSGAQLILGSATPPVAEYYLASQQPDRVITLNQKARSATTPPQLTTIDMKNADNRSETYWLSRTLKTKLNEALEHNVQSLVFLNRRGSARVGLCENCGWSADCSNCFQPFTLHADTSQLKCHVCDARARLPKACPDCGNVDIVYKGVGTKQIESHLKKLFPAARIARFDGDTHKSEDLNALYGDVKAGDIDILIGTQTLVKGLDLPKLGLVAAVQADASMAIPDYSSTERTYQLIHQLIGRVGRDERETEVIIQTYDPSSSSVAFALNNDYGGFYEHEIAQRKAHDYPPFVFILKLNVLYASRARAEEAARAFKATLTDMPGITVLGPAPAFYERQNKKFNQQLVVKSRSRSRLLEIIATLPQNGKWRFELDPQDLL